METELEAAALVGFVGDAMLLETLVELLETAEDETWVLPFLQVRSYNGALLRSVPTMPNDGDGVVG